MAGVDKLVKKMKNRPNGVRFGEIVKVLEHHGYIMVRVSGSHHHFRNENGDVITIPKSESCKGGLCKRCSSENRELKSRSLIIYLHVSPADGHGSQRPKLLHVATVYVGDPRNE